jgi:hypothetical protein
MDRKTKLFALAAMPVLSLLTSVTLAGETNLDDYDVSANGTPPLAGLLKNRNDCPDGTFFKNAYPSLTNGTPGGSATIDFNVDGQIVSMTVTWSGDNSFGFTISGGYAQEIGVTVDTNTFTYDYRTLNATDPVLDDQRLNKLLADGAIAGDVNHLDLCLVALDTEDPVVTITAPSDGGNVSGDAVEIIATITDNEGLETVTATVDGVPPNDGQTIPVTGPTIVGSVYTWTFNASALDVGDYDITVSATDTSILENTATDSITVTVVRTLQDCLEGLDGVPPGGDPNAGGCDLTGFMLLEYPNAAGEAGNLPVAQAAIPAFSSAQNATCGNSANGPFELVAKDPRVDNNGELIGSSYDLDLAGLFNIAGHYAQFHPNEPVPQVIMRADTVGSPCLALLHQDAPAFSLLSGIQELEDGGVYTVTQRPEDVPGMYDGLPRITAPLSVSQPDLQFVEQAALQTDLLALLVEGAASPFTSEVFNASRARGFDGTFFPLNTREVCLSLDPALSPDDADGGAAYFEAVLQCKTDLAVEYFNNMEQVLIEAEPNLVSPALNTLLTPLNKARSMVKVGRWNKANVDLRAFAKEVTDAEWIVDYRNDPGNLIMRIDNLFFRIEQLDWAEANLP